MIKQVELTNRSGHVLRGIVDIPDEGSRFPAIVNVHGFTGNKSGYKNSYTQTARFLAKHGFASVRFDLFGNGESDGEFEDMTFTGILEDIEDIINWTKQQDFADPEKVILSGQSMGGYAAATAAPRVNPYALILMCPGAPKLWRQKASQVLILKDFALQHLLIMIYTSTSRFLPLLVTKVLSLSFVVPLMI